VLISADEPDKCPQINMTSITQEMEDQKVIVFLDAAEAYHVGMVTA